MVGICDHAYNQNARELKAGEQRIKSQPQRQLGNQSQSFFHSVKDLAYDRQNNAYHNLNKGLISITYKEH